MGYTERLKLYKRIMNMRKRPLIAYVTSIRPNMSTVMAGDAISPIIEQIDRIPKEKKEIDFLIISNGGDPITSLRIMSLLRERFDKISVLLPYVAYSAATILSLGADEIIMHPFSNLGPVDPQLTVSKQNFQGQQQKMQFSSEDLRNFIDYIKTDVGISDQQHLISAIAPLLTEVGPLQIGTAKRSQQLSLALSERMLSTHMDDKNKAKSIAKTLNSSFYHHGYAVSRDEASNIGLFVTKPNQDLEKVLWRIWLDFSIEMKCDEPFDVIHEIMSDPVANQQINNMPILNIPVNTPPQIAQQIFLQTVQQTPITTRSSLKRDILLASIESTNFAYAIYNKIEILFWRAADMNLQVNMTTYSNGWHKI